MEGGVALEGFRSGLWSEGGADLSSSGGEPHSALNDRRPLVLYLARAASKPRVSRGSLDRVTDHETCNLKRRGTALGRRGCGTAKTLRSLFGRRRPSA